MSDQIGSSQDEVPYAQLDYAGPRRGLMLDNSGRAKLAVILLLAVAVISLLQIPINLYQASQFDPAAFQAALSGPQAAGPAPATAPAAGSVVAVPVVPSGTSIILSVLMGLFGLLVTGVCVTAVVFYMMWQYRAFQNANTTGSSTHYSPGWSVGWWFIPLVNFIMAGLVLRDLWRSYGLAERGYGLPNLIWCLFVLPFGLGLIGSAVSMYGIFSGHSGFYHLAVWVGVLNTVMSAAFYSLLALYVRRIQGSGPLG